jgi:tetratricopeptide (TPR) repeat protein
VVFWARGDYPKARDYFQRALAIRERALGPEHPDVARALNNLGEVIWSIGDIDQALEIQRRSARIWEQALGAQHPDIAYSLTSLGNIYLVKGDLAQAAATFTRVLDLRKSAFGPDHPLVAWAQNGLGWVHLLRQEHRQAIDCFERVLAVCGADRCMAEEEDPLARARFGLARALWATGGDRRRAVALGRQARELLRKQSNFFARQLLGELESWLKERAAL